MTHRTTRSRRPAAGFIVSFAVAMAGSAGAGAQVLPKIPELDPAKQALAAIQDNEFRTARQAITLVTDPFQKKALLFRLYRQVGNNASAEEIVAFIEGNPDWPLQKTLRHRVEGAHLDKITDGRLIDWFTKNPPTTRLGCTRLVNRLVKRGDRPAADDAIVRCWKSLILSAAGETQFLKQYGDKLSERDKADKVAAHLDRGRYRRAEDLLAQLDLPAKRSIPLEVRIDLQRRPRRSTVPKVLQAIAKLPKETRADPGFLLDLTRWNRRRRNVAAAIKALSEAPTPVTRLPRRWWLERSLVIRLLMNARQFPRAYTLAAAHGQTPGDQFTNAEGLAGWLALRRRRQAQQALTHFRKIYDSAQRNDIRAMAAYWLGETWRTLRQPLKAQTWYDVAAPVSFSLYGHLALMQRKAGQLILPPETKIGDDAKAAFEKTPAVRLVRYYDSKGAKADSRLVLWWMYQEATAPLDDAVSEEQARKTGLRLIQLAELANEFGHRDIALRSARVALPFGFVRLSLAYPAPALPEGLPVEKALVLAITRQESEFNVSARSSANAQGLMQLLPATAKLMARRAKLKWEPEKLLKDGEYNTRLGAAYLSYLLGRFNRSYLLAAAAYNAGPARVDRWIKRYGRPGRQTNPVDWIEAIPYGETRTYVRRVLANVLVYRSRLGDDALRPTPVTNWRPTGNN